MTRLPGKFAAALIIVLLVGLLAPTAEGQTHAGERIVPESWRTENPGPYTIDVTLAIDEEWLEALGADAEHHARQVLNIATDNYRPAGLNLRFSGLTTWTSDTASESIHPLLEELQNDVPAEGASLVVGLTAEAFDSPVDGVARDRSPYVVIRHHPGNLDLDGYVLTHELGHVFGLDHHTCSHDLCFMADHGYDPEEHWCPEHMELLSNNTGYFEYAQTLESRI